MLFTPADGYVVRLRRTHTHTHTEKEEYRFHSSLAFRSRKKEKKKKRFQQNPPEKSRKQNVGDSPVLLHFV